MQPEIKAHGHTTLGLHLVDIHGHPFDFTHQTRVKPRGTLADDLLYENCGPVIAVGSGIDRSEYYGGGRHTLIKVILGYEYFHQYTGAEITSATQLKSAIDYICIYMIKYGFSDFIPQTYIAFGNLIVDNAYMRRRINDIVAIPSNMPDKAPELWPGKWHTTESLTDFTRRIWGKYFLLGIMTREILDDRDHKLLNAINSHRRNGGEWPSDLLFAGSRTTQVDKLLDKFHNEGVKALSSKELVAVARRLQRNEQTNNTKNQNLLISDPKRSKHNKTINSFGNSHKNQP